MTFRFASDRVSTWYGLCGRAQGRDSDPPSAGEIGLRCAAALALGSWREGRAVDALAAALGHGHWAVRDGAAFALGQIGDPRAVPALAACLLDHRIAGTVSAALMKLHWRPVTDRERLYDQLGRNQWEEIARQENLAMEILEKDLASDDERVFECAAFSLIAIGSERAIPLLIDKLRKGTERMAKIYWSSGNPQLQNAAIEWTLANGVELFSLQTEIPDEPPDFPDGRYPELRWGGHDLNPVRFLPERMYLD